MTLMILKSVSQLKRIKNPGKNVFWAWIAYQTVKGTITTSLIWVPLYFVWLNG